MAYQNGTATSTTDLMQKLVAWLTGLGWAQDYSAAAGGGWRAHLHKGGCYVNLQSRNYNVTTSFAIPGAGTSGPAIYNWIDLYLGTGYNGANAFNAQAGGPIGNGQAYTLGCACTVNNGAQTAYHFFSDASADNIVVFVERTPADFAYMGWGTGSGITKHGAWTGGAYFFGNASACYYWASLRNPQAYFPPFSFGVDQGWPEVNAYIRADVDGFAGKWLSMGTANGYTAPSGYTGKTLAPMRAGASALPFELVNYGTLIARSATTVAGGLAVLLPVRLWAYRDAGGMSPLATIPNIFYTAAQGSGYTSGQSYFIGPDEYVIFPGCAIKKAS